MTRILFLAIPLTHRASTRLFSTPQGQMRCYGTHLLCVVTDGTYKDVQDNKDTITRGSAVAAEYLEYVIERVPASHPIWDHPDILQRIDGIPCLVPGQDCDGKGIPSNLTEHLQPVHVPNDWQFAPQEFIAEQNALVDVSALLDELAERKQRYANDLARHGEVSADQFGPAIPIYYAPDLETRKRCAKAGYTAGTRVHQTVVVRPDNCVGSLGGVERLSEKAARARRLVKTRKAARGRDPERGVCTVRVPLETWNELVEHPDLQMAPCGSRHLTVRPTTETDVPIPVDRSGYLVTDHSRLVEVLMERATS